MESAEQILKDDPGPGGYRGPGSGQIVGARK